MRNFFRVRDKKFVIAIVAIAILTTTGVLSKAEERAVFILKAQTDREPTKVTASVDNVSPSRYTTVNVTVTGPIGATVKVVCHYHSGDSSYSAVIGSYGRAVIPVYVSSALSGYAVLVDVSVISDKTYTAQTMFIPH